MPAPQIINAIWEHYRQTVLLPSGFGPSAPDALQELRRAFMAGAFSMELLLRDFLCKDGVDQNTAAEFLTNLDKEAENFKQDVLEGRA